MLLWLGFCAFWLKKASVAALPWGYPSRMRATATFFDQNEPNASHSNIFSSVRAESNNSKHCWSRVKLCLERREEKRREEKRRHDKMSVNEKENTKTLFQLRVIYFQVHGNTYVATNPFVPTFHFFFERTFSGGLRIWGRLRTGNISIKEKEGDGIKVRRRGRVNR